MTTILASMQNSLLVLDSTIDGWKVHEHLNQHNPSSLACDPQNPERAYCGTLDAGLWKTDDNGQTWEKTSLNVSSHTSMSVSVSPVEKGKDGFSRLFVGMEPSVIFSSSDGGQTWENINKFTNCPRPLRGHFPPGHGPIMFVG